MAFSQVVCSSVLDIPGLIGAFASGLGWSVTGSGVTRTLTRPIEPSAASGAPDADIRAATPVQLTGFQEDGGPTGLASSGGGATNRHYVAMYVDGVHQAWAFSPCWNNGDNRQPLIPLPTKLHLFGAGLPRPFLHCVIEYQFNVYRHIYIGSMDRLGNFAPGDVITATQGVQRRNSNGLPFKHDFWPGLFFRGNTTGVSLDNTMLAGGVMLPSGFRRFWNFSSSPSMNFGTVQFSIENVVFGGPRDGLNDIMVSHGFSPFSGETFLSPINLVTDLGPVGASRRAIPLGAVRGIRNVNMRNLEPGELISFGNRNWRVFPQLSKSDDSFTRAGPRPASQPTGTTFNAYITRDTSWHWGVAILEEE